MSYIQPSMFDGYDDKVIESVPKDEVRIPIRPGWRMLSTRTRNIGWHKLKHRTTLGAITLCGRYGFTVAPAVNPDRISPCPTCLELDDDADVG